MLRFALGAASLACSALILCNSAAAEKLAPRHDPVGQLFRRAPMAESSRSIAVNLSADLHLAFDAELCLIHTVWIGSPLNLWGPPYSHAKSPFICNFEGEAVYRFPQLSPFGPHNARFLGHSTKEGFSVSYSVQNAIITERFSGAADRGHWQATRAISVDRRNAPELDLELLVFAAAGATAKIDGHSVSILSSNSVLLLSSDVPWTTRTESVDYWDEQITEAGTEKGNPRTRRTGEETRVFAKIGKAGTARIVFGSTLDPLPASDPAEPALHEFAAAPSSRRPSGDRSYRIEHFPLPPEAEMIVTGMDALPNGDLLLCTWLGDVFVVRGATGAVDKAAFQRIARGLNEPLGLKVHNGQIYVAQKGELTRLSDTDGDSELDRFECISAGWGYSGNYHSYSFGPVVTPESDYFVFVTGQRGRADLLYQGFALKIAGRSGELSPWCDGLRVPHGFGLFRGDMFITDNQGNWIGACKLNHLQEGNFYGFPSSKPSQDRKRNPEEVSAPALWFPRSLSPSTSGFAEINDDRFGPFRGQLAIGDFQNAIVMRAFLEKVNGAWQGAVFPFAKGFLSGVNRLIMNNDGKLYVGGGKRTWSTAAPSEHSLDRLSFTGETPFEISEVRAEPNGFTLAFTKPVHAEDAADPENYLVKQFRYRYHADYGSPEFDQQNMPGATTIVVATAILSDDRLSVRLVMKGLRPGFVTSVQCAAGSEKNEDLRHDTFYYTLNQIPKLR